MIKGCANCNHYELDGSDFPCHVCRDDDQGIPTYWAAKKLETVDHPKHYNHGKYECIDVMLENFGKEAVEHFCLLNAFKYVWRSDYKNGINDVKKAMWYLDKYLELEGVDR